MLKISYPSIANTMAEKELFITATPLIPINGNKNIPTVLFYSPDGQVYIGSSAIEKAKGRRLLNEEFKIELGNADPSSNIIVRQRFKTARRGLKSAVSLTSDFIAQLLKGIDVWIDECGLQKAQWDYCPQHPDLPDRHCYLFDKHEKQEGSFSFKAVGYKCF